MSCLNAAEPNRLAVDRSIGARTITLTTAHLGGAQQHDPNQNTSVTARKYPESSGAYRHKTANPPQNQTFPYVKVPLALQNRQNTLLMAQPIGHPSHCH